MNNHAEGENGTFFMRVDGQPLPKVMWFLNDEPITAIDQRFKSGSDWFDFTLEILKGTADMTGKITAKLKNEFGATDCHSVLEVEG